MSSDICFVTSESCVICEGKGKQDYTITNDGVAEVVNTTECGTCEGTGRRLITITELLSYIEEKLTNVIDRKRAKRL